MNTTKNPHPRTEDGGFPFSKTILLRPHNPIHLITDLPNDLCQDILHGHKADRLAGAVCDDGHVGAGLLHLEEYFLDRCGLFEAGDVVDVVLDIPISSGGDGGHHFLRVDEADELTGVAFGAVVDRVARVFVAIDDGDHAVEGLMPLEGDHAACRDHDVLQLALIESEDVLQVVEFRLVDCAAFIALGDDELELFLGVGRVMPRRPYAECLQEQACRSIQYGDERTRDFAEPVERRGQEERHLLGVLDGEGLWCKLADHDVKQ